MHTALNGLGFVAAIVFILASGAMNWVFMSGQGHSPLEAQILGAVSLGVTAMSALLPFRIAHAWQARHWLKTGLSALAFVLFLSFSLLSALGFAAATRGAVTGGRDTLNGRLQLAEKELSEVDGRLSGMAAGRPASALEQELAALRQRPRWQSSLQCTDATSGDSRKFCEEYLRLKSELENALEVSRLAERQARLRLELKTLKGQGAGQDADPQASTVTKLLQRALPAVDYSDVRLGLTLFVAVLVEFGAAFGLYLTGHDFGKREPARQRHPSRNIDIGKRETKMLAIEPAAQADARSAEEPTSAVLPVAQPPAASTTDDADNGFSAPPPKVRKRAPVAVRGDRRRAEVAAREPLEVDAHVVDVPASSSFTPKATPLALAAPKVAERWQPEHAGRLLAGKQ